MPLRLHENIDPTEVTKRRMAAAEAEEGRAVAQSAGVPESQQKGFAKQWTQAEREMHQKALVDLLRKRK